MLLLRALETGEFRRLGASLASLSDFRVIAIAQPNLSEQVARGEFREDLYYRLDALRIVVPPLRDRESDGLEIAQQFATVRGLQLDGSAKELVLGCRWPGNVRQLLHCMEVAAASIAGPVIRRADLLCAIERHSSTGVLNRPSHVDATEVAWSRAIQWGAVHMDDHDERSVPGER